MNIMKVLELKPVQLGLRLLSGVILVMLMVCHIRESRLGLKFLHDVCHNPNKNKE